MNKLTLDFDVCFAKLSTDSIVLPGFEQFKPPNDFKPNVNPYLSFLYILIYFTQIWMCASGIAMCKQLIFLCLNLQMKYEII